MSRMIQHVILTIINVESEVSGEVELLLVSPVLPFCSHLLRDSLSCLYDIWSCTDTNTHTVTACLWFSH